jgi:chromate reductase
VIHHPDRPLLHVLGISGSLRANSSNARLLRAAAAVAPPGMEVEVYEGLATLPHFNPDDDGEGAVPPPPVANLREAVGRADAIVISSPEYAHGVPGSLKNALDWLVSSEEIVGMPIALLNASPVGGEWVESALAETLRTMSTTVVLDTPLRSPDVRRRLGRPESFDDPAVASALRATFEVLARTVATTRSDA